MRYHASMIVTCFTLVVMVLAIADVHARQTHSILERQLPTLRTIANPDRDVAVAVGSGTIPKTLPAAQVAAAQDDISPDYFKSEHCGSESGQTDSFVQATPQVRPLTPDPEPVVESEVFEPRELSTSDDTLHSGGSFGGGTFGGSFAGDSFSESSFEGGAFVSPISKADSDSQGHSDSSISNESSLRGGSFAPVEIHSGIVELPATEPMGLPAAPAAPSIAEVPQQQPGLDNQIRNLPFQLPSAPLVEPARPEERIARFPEARAASPQTHSVDEIFNRTPSTRARVIHPEHETKATQTFREARGLIQYQDPPVPQVATSQQGVKPPPIVSPPVISTSDVSGQPFNPLTPVHDNLSDESVMKPVSERIPTLQTIAPMTTTPFTTAPVTTAPLTSTPVTSAAVASPTSTRQPAAVAVPEYEPSLEAVGVTSSFESAPAVTISPLLTDAGQPGEQSQVASFLIANGGTAPADDLEIEFSVDGDAVIQAIYPTGNVIGQRRARVMIESLEPGESREVAISAFSETGPAIVIDTRLITKTVQSFPIQNRYATENLPPLKVTIEGPEKIIVGEPAEFHAYLENASRRNITRPYVSIDADPSFRLVNPEEGIQGSQELASGQAMEVVFTMIAGEAGRFPLVLTAGAAEAPANQHRYSIDTRLPVYKVSISGPEIMNLGAEADFALRVENTSAQPLEAVDVQLQLPAGLQLSILDRDAVVDNEAGTVIWHIPVIKTGFSEIIRFRGQASGGGDHQCIVRVAMPGFPITESMFTTGVINQTSLGIHIKDAPYSLPVGTPVGMEILIDNHGQHKDRGVELTVQLPEGVQAYPGETFELIETGTLKFKPFDLPAGTGKKIIVYVVGEAGGTKPVHASVKSAMTGNANSDIGELLFHNGPSASEQEVLDRISRQAEAVNFDR